MSDFTDQADGGGVLHRLMSKMSVRHKKDDSANDFTYYPVEPGNSHVRQSSDPVARRRVPRQPTAPQRPRVNLNNTSEIMFKDVYSKPLTPEEDHSQSATYIRDIPPQATSHHHPRAPFYTPPGTAEKNVNNNHLDPAPPNPPPRHHQLSTTTSISHRRTKSNPSDRKITPLRIPAANLNANVKYGTVPSPISPNPANHHFDPLKTPITPGINENPLAFRLRANEEKSRSLQNQPNRMEVPAEQSLDFLLYGPNALKYNEFKHSQELDRSQAATDWEGLEKIKRNLKQDHQEITQRLSKRFSRDFNPIEQQQQQQIIPSHAGGLSDEEHFYFKPGFTRDDANLHLAGLAQGSFIVRQSRHSNSYALSLATIEQGVQHILVQQCHETCQWQISQTSGTAALNLPAFVSVPQLVQHYQKHKLPIKNCQRDVYLK